MVSLTVASEFGYVLAIALLYQLEVMFFAFKVGSMRKKHNVKYPEVNGPPEFNRAMRVHYNALEGMSLFLVCLVLCGLYAPMLAVLGGVIYMVGRFVYALGYYVDAEKRVAGALVFHVAELILLYGSAMLCYSIIVQ